MSLKVWVVLVLLASAVPASAELAAESVAQYGNANGARHLLVLGTTDIALFADVLEGFAKNRPDLAVTYEQWASNDLYASAAAACNNEDSLSDMLITSSVDQAVKLVNDGCARPYRSSATDALPAGLNWRSEVFGVTREPAVIVYNRKLVPAAIAPQTRFDLIDLLRPEGSPYAGRVATYDIEASGLGYLFAFMDSQQATTYGSLLEAFGRSGAVATCCSAEIIDGVARGDFAIAYNVLGSYAVARATENSDLVVVAPQDYTLMLSRAAMIPRRAANTADAEALIDYLLSEPGRDALAKTHLIVSDDDGAFLRTGDDNALVRQIALSPILLVGLDQAKRKNFVALWNETFPGDQR